MIGLRGTLCEFAQQKGTIARVFSALCGSALKVSVIVVLLLESFAPKGKSLLSIDLYFSLARDHSHWAILENLVLQKEELSFMS